MAGAPVLVETVSAAGALVAAGAAVVVGWAAVAGAPVLVETVSAAGAVVAAVAAVVVGWAAVAGAPVLVEAVSAAGAVVAAVVGSVGCSAWATLALEVLVACVASARLFDLAPRLVLLHSSSLFVSLYLLYIDISCPCGGNVTAHKPVAARPWGEGEWGAHIGTTKLPDLRCRFHRCLLTVLPLDFVLNLADCSST